jgi:hypothetical protein
MYIYKVCITSEWFSEGKNAEAVEQKLTDWIDSLDEDDLRLWMKDHSSV